MKTELWDEMYVDFDSMIDKLKYYTEIARDYGSGEEMPEEEIEDGEEEEGEGNEGVLNPKADPKGAAILVALKRKMKE